MTLREVKRDDDYENFQRYQQSGGTDMKRMIINLCVAGLTGLGIVSAQSEGFIGQELENGSINYADRTISATGIGFIPEG